MNNEKLMFIVNKSEFIYLVIFFFAFFYLGAGTFFESNLIHEFPWKYGAGDAFAYNSYSQMIKDTGHLKLPAYMTGGINDAEFYQPPLRPISDALLSDISGLPVHDAGYMNLFFLTFLSILVIYVMIKRISQSLAAVSLPFTLLIFKFPFTVQYFWGIWSFTTGICIFIAFCWSISKFGEVKYIEIPITILLIGILFSYAHFLFISMVIAFFYLSYLWLKKRITLKRTIFKFGMLLLISFLCFFYYYSILSQGYDAQNYKLLQNENPKEYTLTKVPLFNDLGFYVLSLLFLGVFLSLVIKKEYITFLSGILLVYINSYFIFGANTFKLRYFLPVYFCFYIGLPLYVLISYLPFIKRNKRIFFNILAIFLIIAIGLKYNFQLDGFLFSEPAHNQAYHWVNKNTPVNSTVLSFYGDYFVQNTQLVIKRIPYAVELQDITEKNQEKKVSRKYNISLISDAGRTKLIKKTGIFSYETLKNQTTSYPTYIDKDICFADYFVFEKVGTKIELIKYNQFIINAMFKKNLSVAYENDYIIILKNTNKGDCIETGTF